MYKEIEKLFPRLYEKKLDYLHAKKARILEGVSENKSEDAYALNIRKINCLSDEQRDLLVIIL